MLTEQNATNKKEARSRREAIYWAAVLIWAGLVFGAERLGVLPQVGSADAWNWVFFGAGLFALVNSLLCATAPDRPDATSLTWNFVWAGVLLILGLSPLASVKIGVPLILVLVGVALLATSLFPTKKSLS